MSRVPATKSGSRRKTAPSYGFDGRGTRAHLWHTPCRACSSGDGVSGAISMDAVRLEPVAASLNRGCDMAMRIADHVCSAVSNCAEEGRLCD